MPIEPTRQVLNGPTMGTRYAAVFHGVVPHGLGEALQSAVDLVDSQMSTWKPDSDLMRFNRAPVGEWVTLPAEIVAVISEALMIGRKSGGCFDIGLGAAVAAWGFASTPHRVDPVRVATVSATPPRAAYDLLELDIGQKLLRKIAPVELDLSGIAKGFGVDQLAGVLDRHGITAYLVSIDGEVRARGHKPDGSLWTVGIEEPIRGRREIGNLIDLGDAALATSGDYRHWVDHEGQSHAHTIDPRTGRPLRNNLAAVTVRARTCMAADAWATALMVLGAEAGDHVARLNGIEALFVIRDAGESNEHQNAARHAAP